MNQARAQVKTGFCLDILRTASVAEYGDFGATTTCAKASARSEDTSGAPTAGRSRRQFHPRGPAVNGLCATMNVSGMRIMVSRQSVPSTQISVKSGEMRSGASSRLLSISISPPRRKTMNGGST